MDRPRPDHRRSPQFGPRCVQLDPTLLPVKDFNGPSDFRLIAIAYRNVHAPCVRVETPTYPIRVAVVDDRREDRDRVVRLLTAAPRFDCVAACTSGQEALAALPPLAPDVVLMDINMSGMSGVECAGKLKALLPDTQIMMLTVVEDHEQIFQSLASGANGYLLKKTSPLHLLEAIEELSLGGAPMSGQIARLVVGTFQKLRRRDTTGSGQLSPVEQEVLQRLARGLLYKEVAEEMGISQGTVRTHIWHIYRKLHVNNRTEAVLKGLPRC